MILLVTILVGYIVFCIGWTIQNTWHMRESEGLSFVVACCAMVPIIAPIMLLSQAKDWWHDPYTWSKS